MTEKRILKALMWTVAAIALLFLGVFLLLYSAFFQDLVVDTVSAGLSNQAERRVSVGSFRLSFPLTVEINDLLVVENGDTMIGADGVVVESKLLPLFGLRAEVERVSLDAARFRLGAHDSTLYLRADNVDLDIDDVTIALNASTIDIDKVDLKRGRLKIALGNDSTKTPTDSTEAVSWIIKSRLIELSDVDYEMTMLPSEDSTRVFLSYAAIQGGYVDLATETIKVESLRVTESDAVYAKVGYEPADGLDFGYISLADIDIVVDSFYSRPPVLRVPLTKMAFKERSGLEINVSGIFAMDSLAMELEAIKAVTAHSAIGIEGYMGLGDVVANPAIPMGVDAEAMVGIRDLELAFPLAKPVLALLSNHEGLSVTIDADGSMAGLSVKELSATLPGSATIGASGQMTNLYDLDKLNGHLDIDGDIKDVNFLKPALLDETTAEMVNLPPLVVDGAFDVSGGTYQGEMTAVTSGGRLALDGKLNGDAEFCAANLDLDSFPLQAFLVGMDIGPVSGKLNGKISGFDIFAPSTSIDAAAQINSIFYNGIEYSDIHAVANVANGGAEIIFVSYNPSLDFDVAAEGSLVGDTLEWDIEGEIHNLDLMAMKLSETKASGLVYINGDISVTKDFKYIDAKVTVPEVDWSMDGLSLNETGIHLDLMATDRLLAAKLDNGDLRVDFKSQSSLDSVMSRFVETREFIDSTLSQKWLDVVALQRALPTFELSVRAGNDNILTNYLSVSDMGFSAMSLDMSNDSLITLGGRINRLRSGMTRIDEITIDVGQEDDRLTYSANMNNNPGTLDQWAHVALDGYFSENKLKAFVSQQNIDNVTGYRLGAELAVTDSIMTLNITPHDPVIAYKNWTVNPGNYLTIHTLQKHFDADIDMRGNGSSVRFFTRHVDGEKRQEDVVVQVENLHLADWIPVNPFEASIAGDLFADVSLGWGDGELNGGGNIGLKNLYYDRQRVGSFDFDVNLSTNRSGTMRAEASLLVDDVKTITAIGNLNDTTQANPFNLDFTMIRFPLRVVNPFMPKGTAKLGGMLNGKMDITGTIAAPVFNGALDFDTTAIKINMLGTTLRFAETPIAVKDNVITFDSFKIKGINENPLSVDGTVDFKDMTDMSLDLVLKARDMQIVGSERARGAEVYGRAFVNFDATARGSLGFLDVDASVSLLPGTNVTYVMTDAQSALTSQSTGDMVRFVNFADTAMVESADSIAPPSMLMDLSAAIDIRQGAILNVDLSPDGSNRAQVQGSGSFTYTQSIMGDTRFLGRYNINKGYVKYSMPLISEKNFEFKDGSYIAFNGDMLNPILNIHAVEQVKASVSSDGQNSRLVTFDVGLSATNTLSNMNVVFDLSTEDDITVQNELQAMSPEQRANQAMNILLYGMYTGAGTKGDANGNYLYSFLESKLNSWVANNIKVVDISFGIDQYSQLGDGASQTTTSYSYKLSKSMFNDRFKISVGGNYTTDADADENLSQNLINDISFEYSLNKSGSMLIRLFRHVGYESILEGEVTQTGVGFVYKRKIRRIGDMFRWFPSRRKKGDTEQPQQIITKQPSEDEQK